MRGIRFVHLTLFTHEFLLFSIACHIVLKPQRIIHVLHQSIYPLLSSSSLALEEEVLIRIVKALLPSQLPKKSEVAV